MYIEDAVGHAGRHHARLKLKIGRLSVLRADVAISSSGLLAIGGLVSSILLSTAVIVQVAKDRREPAPARPEDIPFRT